MLVSTYRISALSGITALLMLYTNTATANPVLLQAFSYCEKWVTESKAPNPQIQLNKLLQIDRGDNEFYITYASPVISIVIKTHSLEGIIDNQAFKARSCTIEPVDISRGNYRERLRSYDVGSTWDNVEVLSRSEVRKTLNFISQRFAQSPNYILHIDPDALSNHGKNTSFFGCGPHRRLVEILPDGVLPFRKGQFNKWSIIISQHSFPPQGNILADCPSG